MLLEEIMVSEWSNMVAAAGTINNSIRFSVTHTDSHEKAEVIVSVSENPRNVVVNRSLLLKLRQNMAFNEHYDNSRIRNTANITTNRVQLLLHIQFIGNLPIQSKKMIKATSQQIEIRAHNIRGIIQQEFPESAYIQRDTYNARAAIARENLNGHHPTAALIKPFDKKKISYIIK
jgi:hypothetical protein